MNYQLTNKKATSRTPQVVTLLLDDSGSMAEKNKCVQVTAAVQDVIIGLQVANQNASLSRFIVNLAKFGDDVTPLASAGAPEDINVDELTFVADSGTTEIAKGLEWAAQAVEAGLARARRAPNYDESAAPNPLVVLISDGANSGPDPAPAVSRLLAIPFQGGGIDFVTCGVELDSASEALMKQWASRSDLSVNISADKLREFIAAVGATVQRNETPKQLVQRVS